MMWTRPVNRGKKWRGVCKVLVPVWFIFAIGPGAMLSSSAFSFAGFPPIWSWQIAWWIYSIVMMWALCFKAEFSTETPYMLEEAEKQHAMANGQISPTNQRSDQHEKGRLDR